MSFPVLSLLIGLPLLTALERVAGWAPLVVPALIGLAIAVAFAREGDPAVRADFGIGSGNHTRSFLWLCDGLLRVTLLKDGRGK